MKLNRLQQILIGLLIVQIALGTALLWPRQAAAESVPLLGDVTLDSITGLVIADSTGTSLAFHKTAEGWVMPDNANYPAKESEITKTLEELLDTTTARLVTKTATSHKPLKVAEDAFERKLTIKTADGSTYEVLVGTLASTAANHVRLLPGDEVYLSSELAYYRIYTTLSSWADTAYVSAASTDVTSLSLENANGIFKFERIDEATWKMDGVPSDREFNQNNLTSLVSRFTSLRLEEPVALLKDARPEYGLDDPQCVVSAMTSGDNPRTITITIGAMTDDEKFYYASSNESEYIVKVTKLNAETFLNKTLEDFLVQPTPVPTSTTQP